jgi:hypothetical protein
MELDPAKLNDYPIKILQNYCKTQNLAVRGTRKNDYVLVILAHLQKNNKDIKIASASKLGIDADTLKKWEADEDRRREEERIKYEQWRSEEEERKKKAREEELRVLEAQQHQQRKEEEAKREWSERKKKGARRREIDAKRAQEQSFGSVGQLPWVIETCHPYPSTSDSSTPSPPTDAHVTAGSTTSTSQLPDVAPASDTSSPPASPTPGRQRAQGQMRCLHVDKPKPGHVVRVLAALELKKKGQRSLVVIDKPGLSYLEQLEQAEVWVGTRGGKVVVYTIDLKHLKDARSEKWKKKHSLRVRDEREKQSVRQLVQAGQRVWAMAEAEEPAVFDIKVLGLLGSLPSLPIPTAFSPSLSFLLVPLSPNRVFNYF